MDAFSMFFLFLVGITCSAILIKSCNTKDWFDVVLSFLGIIFLGVVLVAAPFNGEPSKEIADGSYQISFIHERGTELVLGLEIKKNPTESSLIVYIFPKDAFFGEIKKEAKQLKVYKAGSFRKIVLE